MNSISMISLEHFTYYFELCFPNLDLDLISQILDIYLPIPKADCILQLSDKLAKILGKDKNILFNV